MSFSEVMETTLAGDLRCSLTNGEGGFAMAESVSLQTRASVRQHDTDPASTTLSGWETSCRRSSQRGMARAPCG